MIEKAKNKENKKMKLKLINSSVAIDLIFIGFLIWGSSIANMFNKYIFLILTFLGFTTIYHLSWRTIIINRDGVELQSIFPFLSPISISYFEVKKTKSTGLSFVIDFSGFRKKLKLDLIYPIWAEFLTFTASPDQIDEAIGLIYEYKEDRQIFDDEDSASI